MTDVLILDLETTGKLDPKHRIIEFAGRVCNLESGEEKSNLLLRLNPERNIDAKAFAVHGIALDDLKGCPTIEASLSTISELLNSVDLVVAHNGGGPAYEQGFDYPFLKMEYERIGEPMPEKPWFDTMVHGTFATDLGKSPSLKELCFALDVDYDDSLAHKGDYDTAVLRDCFFNGLRWKWYKL